MVVVAGEVFGELEPGVLVVGDDPVHDAGLLEDDEVAVRAALRQPASRREDLGKGERAGGLAEDVDDRLAISRDALADATEPRGDLLALVKIGDHEGECTVGSDGSDRAVRGARAASGHRDPTR